MPDGENEAVLIAQITDTHIRAKGKLLHHMVPTARYLKRAIAQLEALGPRPDLVVATGDLVDRGKPKEYRRLRKLLARLSLPLLVLPGNHDDREAFRHAFADAPYLPRRGPLHYAVDVGTVRIIALDTTRPGHPGGELDAARLTWLDARLCEAATRPTLIFMHHPPFLTGVGPMDAHGFRGREAFEALIARHRHVVRIACGHVHRALAQVVGSTLATTAPSTAPQLVVDRTAAGWYGIRLEPAAFALHRWTGRQVETTISQLDLTGGQGPFTISA